MIHRLVAWFFGYQEPTIVELKKAAWSGMPAEIEATVRKRLAR